MSFHGKPGITNSEPWSSHQTLVATPLGTASLLSDRQRGWPQDILDNVGAIKRHLDHL